MRRGWLVLLGLLVVVVVAGSLTGDNEPATPPPPRKVVTIEQVEAVHGLRREGMLDVRHERHGSVCLLAPAAWNISTYEQKIGIAMTLGLYCQKQNPDLVIAEIRDRMTGAELATFRGSSQTVDIRTP